MAGDDSALDDSGNAEDDIIAGNDVITNDGIIVAVDTEGVANGSKRRSVLKGRRRPSVGLERGPMSEGAQSNTHIITLKYV